MDYRIGDRLETRFGAYYFYVGNGLWKYMPRLCQFENNRHYLFDNICGKHLLTLKRAPHLLKQIRIVWLDVITK